MTLHIDDVDELLNMPDLSQERLEIIAREALLVRLYELALISSGKAAEMLHTSRREFLDLLGQYGVSEYDEHMDLEAEVRRG
jgi:predicted HTH domain antitoxin